MKRLHEEITKESNESKSSAPRTQNNSPEPTQQQHRMSTLSITRSALSISHEATSFLAEISLTFHFTNSEIVQRMTQSLQQLEYDLFLNFQKGSPDELRAPRHKYLRGSSPTTAEEVSETAPSSKKSLSSVYLNSLHQKMTILKHKWMDASSKFQNILVSVCHLLLALAHITSLSAAVVSSRELCASYIRYLSSSY
jgi:hypothetical protein